MNLCSWGNHQGLEDRDPGRASCSSLTVFRSWRRMTSLLLALLLMICGLVVINGHISKFVCGKGTQWLLTFSIKYVISSHQRSGGIPDPTDWSDLALWRYPIGCGFVDLRLHASSSYKWVSHGNVDERWGVRPYPGAIRICFVLKPQIRSIGAHTNRIHVSVHAMFAVCQTSQECHSCPLTHVLSISVSVSLSLLLVSHLARGTHRQY
jgi:hypothetical protein